MSETAGTPDIKRIAEFVTRYQQKRRRRNPSQRHGRKASGA